MKGMGKYFVALLLPPELEADLKSLKQRIAEQYQVKYALHSPGHLTLKMPFLFKESKENELALRLTQLVECQENFQLQLTKTGFFGWRNIHQQLAPSESLLLLQSTIRGFCKRHLHLTEELSDRNFQPHVTLAYKDLKQSNFEKVFEFASRHAVQGSFIVDKAHLLKKVDGRWIIFSPLKFGQMQENPVTARSE